MRPTLSRRDAALWRTIGLAVVVGLVTGALVVAYRMLLAGGLEVAGRVYDAVARRPVLAVPWVVGAVAVGLGIGALVRAVPAASGSGIPQVKGMIVYRLRMPALRVLAARFAGGGLGSLAGLSLGREGPCVQIGGSTGDLVARAARSRGTERDHLVSAGASAGLAAAFNAPLSGAVFALEELHRTFSPLVLVVGTSAALTADVVTAGVFGLRPVLDLGAPGVLPLTQYPWLLLLGPVTGVVAVASGRLLLRAQEVAGRLPVLVRPVLALLLALPVGLLAPSLLGGGDDLVASAAAGAAPALVLGGLLVGKMLFTATSFGSGTPGGVFMPLLSIGALTGALVAAGAHAAGLPTAARSSLVLCAMAGVLAAALQAPMTAVLLVVEMSGQVSTMLPVAGCALLALLTADLLRGRPLYDALLERLLASLRPDGRRGEEVVVETVVDLGSPAAGTAVQDLPLPDGVRLVELRRGLTSHEPRGDTVLLAGDAVAVAYAAEGMLRPGRTRARTRALFRAPGPGAGQGDAADG